MPPIPKGRRALSAKNLAIRAVALLAILLCLGEISLRLLGSGLVEAITTTPPSDREIRQPVTRLLLPDLTLSASGRLKGRAIYDVSYHTDHFGRRVAYDGAASAAKAHHLILFGGTKLFGPGVSDDQTIAYYLGKALPQFEPLAYGVSSGSMSNMLAILATRPMASQVSQPEGVLVYLLFPGQDAKRAAGFRSNLLFGFENPYFRLEGGRPVLAGTFLEASPWVKVWAFLMGHTRLTPRLANFFERPAIRADYALAQSIILESKRRYLAHFPRGRFIVATMEPENELVQLLKKDEVELISLRNMAFGPESDPAFYLPEVGYFSPKGNQAIAEDLAKGLRAHLAEQGAAH